MKGPLCLIFRIVYVLSQRQRAPRTTFRVTFLLEHLNQAGVREWEKDKAVCFIGNLATE